MKNQHRQQATVYFAGITFVGLIGLIALLGFAPLNTIISQASRPKDQIHTIKPLINVCKFSYHGCDDSIPTIDLLSDGDSPETATLIAKSYDLNPQLLLTLSRLASPNETLIINQTQLTQIAQKIKNAYKFEANKEIPARLSHPTLGEYRLENIDLANYVLISYLSQMATTKQEFEEFVAAPNSSDGQVIGFQETYTSLFNTNPLSP
jgi:hypothetical protein